MRVVLIVVLLGLLVWFGRAIMELESYRYASELNFCPELAGDPGARARCWREVETRWGWWNLYYGLGFGR